MTGIAYEPHELMITRIAAEITEVPEHVVVMGSFTPLAYAAYMLARMTQAPDAWMIGYNAIGVLPIELSFAGTEGAIYKGSLASGSFVENGNVVHLNTRGLLECVSSAQMDGSGAINLSVIGPYDHPKVRLPGGAGAPEVIQNYRKVVAYFAQHDARTLVSEVDFVTGRRTPVAAEARSAKGLVGGPIIVVTPKAVLRKDDEGPFRVESVTRGIDVQDVVDSTGFSLQIPDVTPYTVEPTSEQLTLLRDQIDPFCTARFDFLKGPERLDYLAAILAKEWDRARSQLTSTDEA